MPRRPRCVVQIKMRNVWANSSQLNQQRLASVGCVSGLGCPRHPSARARTGLFTWSFPGIDAVSHTGRELADRSLVCALFARRNVTPQHCGPRCVSSGCHVPGSCLQKCRLAALRATVTYSRAPGGAPPSRGGAPLRGAGAALRVRVRVRGAAGAAGLTGSRPSSRPQEHRGRSTPGSGELRGHSGRRHPTQAWPGCRTAAPPRKPLAAQLHGTVRRS